jgi:hypothetical protein
MSRMICNALRIMVLENGAHAEYDARCVVKLLTEVASKARENRGAVRELSIVTFVHAICIIGEPLVPITHCERINDTMAKLAALSIVLRTIVPR